VNALQLGVANIDCKLGKIGSGEKCRTDVGTWHATGVMQQLASVLDMLNIGLGLAGMPSNCL